MTDATKTAISAMQQVTLFNAYTDACRNYHRTDKQRFLRDAMEIRKELINSGAFTSDYLDGISMGMQITGPIG